MAFDTGLGLGLGLGLGDGLMPGEGLGLGDGLMPGEGLGLGDGLMPGEGLGLGVLAPADVTATHAENSDVSPVDTRLAVAVSFAPTATETGNACENVACPALLVVTGVEPRNTAPSPNPEGSHEGLAKNSIVNWPEDEVSSVP